MVWVPEGQYPTNELAPVADIVPPLLMVIPLAGPKAPPGVFGAVVDSVPALTVTAPVKVFSAESVQVPVPALVTVPDVVPMMLARLLAVLVPPNVNPKVAPVIVPALERTMFPLLATILLALPSVINPL
jgi:hypothetical protein